jgi:hypothetical protein
MIIDHTVESSLLQHSSLPLRIRAYRFMQIRCQTCVAKIESNEELWILCEMHYNKYWLWLPYFMQHVKIVA